MCVRSMLLTPTHIHAAICPCRSHHLRKLDRNMNGIRFPSLYFPELYLLHGGYKAMFTAVEAKAATAVSPATEQDRHAHTSEVAQAEPGLYHCSSPSSGTVSRAVTCPCMTRDTRTI